ncbi:MAG TPA: penicillin-binding transpeptidase domain-containing protein, partial [Ktedonobacterales bacterium]|nr:penicillin-binding transpeptidase domain-containing protein [Ktedonobacterales bacterium]
GGVCEAAGTQAVGSLTVEDPNTGEILAMVSHPYYDPNQIDNPTYWQQINSDPDAPLLNHATQGLYDPGSTFKTLTLMAALNEGTISLNTEFDKNTAVYYQVPDGEQVNWIDYLDGVWPNIQFPITTKDAYAYSDNSLFAREAVNLGGDKWLSYVRDFGIQTPAPGMPSVSSIPFDAPQNQSTAFNAISNGKNFSFSGDLLAESGFGQGELFVTPLTMEEIVSTVAANGVTYEPHIGWKIVPHGQSVNTTLPVSPVQYGEPIRPETAQNVRAAMWAVASYGTGAAGLSPYNGHTLATSGVYEGGKTGTAQTDQANPETWWISLAPDDQAPGAPGGAKYAITLMKENSGEGACQVYVADSVYQYAMQNNIGY